MEIKEKVENFVKESFERLGIPIEEVVIWKAEKDICSFDVLAKDESVYSFRVDTKDLLIKFLDKKYFTKKDVEKCRQIYSYKEL